MLIQHHKRCKYEMLEEHDYFHNTGNEYILYKLLRICAYKFALYLSFCFASK